MTTTTMRKRIGAIAATVALTGAGMMVTAAPAQAATTLSVGIYRYGSCTNIGGMGDQNYHQGSYQCWARKIMWLGNWTWGPHCIITESWSNGQSRSYRAGSYC